MHWLQTGRAGKSATHSLRVLTHSLTYLLTYLLKVRRNLKHVAAEPIVYDYKVDKSSEGGGEQRGGDGRRGGGGERAAVRGAVSQRPGAVVLTVGWRRRWRRHDGGRNNEQGYGEMPCSWSAMDSLKPDGIIGWGRALIV